MKLSVIITTFNAAKTIKQALESVQFADEIVLVDLESTDKTVEIVQKFQVKLISHQNLGYVEPIRNFSIDQAQGEWILIIDADEEVSPGLRKAIEGIINAPDQSELPDCFYLPRKNIIFDKWIQTSGWWPDFQLRLFRKGHVEWSEQIHSVPITTGEVKEFPADEKLAIIHHNYQTVDQFIRRLNRYTTIQAQEQINDQSVSPTDVLAVFTDSFLSRFFASQGYREGMHGVALSLLQSSSEAIVELKKWQLSGFDQRQTQADDILKQLRHFQKELNYWLAETKVQSSTGLAKWWWQIRRKLMI